MKCNDRQQALAGLGFTLDELVSDAIALLKEFEPDGEYYGCFSGGKDSVVIKELARVAGVRVAWHYNVTTIDPPELVRFIREHHADVMWERPACGPFFRMVVRKGVPTRRSRWCCEHYKERSTPPNSVMIIGVRGEESPRRAATWTEVGHRRNGSVAVAPILRWSSTQVWEFIHSRHLPYCGLYDEGFHRLGCIGCPMARRAGRLKEFARWPGYERQWKRAFRLLWERRGSRPGVARFESAEQMWEWWMSDTGMPHDDDCQLDMWSNE